VSSIPDFTRYVPPDVYVDPDAIPTVAPQGVDPTIVALIGQGVGYHTYTETVSFATATSAVLSKRGINPSSLVVQGRITDPAAPGQTVPYTFAADVVGTPADYSTTVNAATGLDTSTVTLARTTTGKIETSHPEVTVTYRYTDADYHALHAFDDFDSLTEVYGQPFDPANGAIQSPLALAAQIAMQNGANQIYTVALSGTGTIQQQFIDAYGLLAGNYEVNVVVPLVDGIVDDDAVAGLMQTFKALVENDAADGFLRIAIMGFDKDYDPTPTDLAGVATATSSTRVVLAWPNRLNVYNGVLNQTIEIDGYYLAAAYSGMLSSRSHEIPLTHKYPVGFIGLPTPVKQAMTKAVKNQLSGSGVCVTEVNRNGRLMIRHGLTTDFSGGVLAREISLVRAQDALYNLVDDTLKSANMIGLPIQDDTALRVKGICQGALEQAKIRGLINDYNNLKVRQQSPPSGDPTIIEVRFQYKPSWPLNYILVSFSVDTNTGESTLTSVSSTAISDAANTAAAGTS
jgi:hypothetical protein